MRKGLGKMGSEKILVVDDEEPFREMVSRMVSHLGYDVATASQGKEALEILRREPFSVLITDLEMPEMDGLELIQATRKEFPSLSVLMMSAHEKVETYGDAVARGEADFVTKPCTLDEMRIRLARILHEKNRMERLAQKSVELGIANEELKRLDQLKSKFVSGLSEELQTPLTVIKEFVSLLLKGQAGPLNEEQKEYLGVAHRNILRLSHLTEKLLDFSRIEAGKGLRLRLKPTMLRNIIEDAMMALSPQIEEKKIAVENRIDAEIPQVLVDRERMMEVFVNLIGNGLKFTPPGGKVTVDSKGLTEDRGWLKVVVTDTGIGIDPEDLPRIFERFYQGRRTQEGVVRGTGQGLFITKEIVEGHQGNIQVESKVGGGSSFVFTLPLYGIGAIFNLMIRPMLEEAERDSLPLSLIQVVFWNQQTKRELTFTHEARDELVSAIQNMVRSVDTVFPSLDHKFYILTFNDKKLVKEIGKRVQGKLSHGNYLPKKTEIQWKTFSYPQEAPSKEDFLRGCRVFLKEE